MSWQTYLRMQRTLDDMASAIVAAVRAAHRAQTLDVIMYTNILFTNSEAAAAVAYLYGVCVVCVCGIYMCTSSYMYEYHRYHEAMTRESCH